ncbi:hypothetical protein KC333_g5556 [Hortaea werneckii]|nr:hypothetical protein KC333_g5556 [Hortaea werneckii]KAI7308718.1 hypothetical protein KC326_g7319 [Hortaea werneckii]
MHAALATWQAEDGNAAEADDAAQHEPAIQQEPAIQREPAVQHEPAIRHEPAIQHEPAVQQEPAFQREPAVQHEPAAPVQDDIPQIHVVDDDDDENVSFGPFDETPVQPRLPSHSVSPAIVQTISPFPLSTLPLNFDVADQSRLPFVSRLPGGGLHKTQELYGPSTVPDKWWSDAWVPERNRTGNKERDASHVKRIMETDAGELYLEPCESCASSRHECWGYSKAGKDRVYKPGDRCARCRLGNQACSHSKRKKSTRGSRPFQYPGPRDLAPKGPFESHGGSSPPPGTAGSAGLMAC